MAALSPKRPLPPLVAPATALAGVAGATFLWRTLAWPSAASPDAWAYTAAGQAIARGDRPDYELTMTTPKPLATLLGVVASPLPPSRAFGVVIAVALGVLAAALFAAAQREAGSLAALVAVAAFAVGAQLDRVIWFSLIDGVTAALVALALAVRGRPRILFVVLAGLLRPEAWPLAAATGWLETGGQWRRRAAVSVSLGVLPAAVWLTLDFALAGDILAIVHETEDVAAATGDQATAWGDLPNVLVSRLVREGGILVVVLGVFGLGVELWRARGISGLDSFPLVALVVWPLALGVEFRLGLPANARYLLPVVVVLAFGCGLLAGRLVPALRHALWPTAAVTTAVVAVTALGMDFDAAASRSADHVRAVERSLPTVESVLACGPLGLTGSVRARRTLPQLAAATREPLGRFGLLKEGRSYAGVLRVGRGGQSLPDWRRARTALGPLVVAPHCNAVLVTTPADGTSAARRK